MQDASFRKASFMWQESRDIRGYLNDGYAPSNVTTAKIPAISHSNIENPKDARDAPVKAIATTNAPQPS